LDAPAAAWPEPVQGHLPGAALYWTCQGVVLVVAILLGVAVLRGVMGRRERDGLGVERSARFANTRDLRALVVRRSSPGRVVLGKAKRRLIATERRTSVCVIGPTQSGKTSALGVPTLLELRRGGGAVLALSVKGDLYEETHRRRSIRGAVKVFDPTRIKTQRSDTWSPLRRAGTIRGAQGAARSLFELAARAGVSDADYWMEAGTNLLWPLLYVAAHMEEGSMADVVRWVTTHDRPRQDTNGKAVRSEVAENIRTIEARIRTGSTGPDGPVAEHFQNVRNAIQGTWVLDGRTQSNIYSTTRTVIDPWSDPVVAEACSSSEITPEWLLGGDNTAYIVSPAHDQKRLQRVFASMVSDLVHAAFEIASRTRTGELPRRLLVLLDEAANICPVPELPAWCSTCASHGITLVTMWQDRSQQRSRYGPDGAETIWNNSGAKLILSGISDAATSEVVRQLGEEEHSRVSSSVDLGLGNGRRSVSNQTATRPLVSADSLRRQTPGQALLIYKHLPPVRLRLRPWRSDRRLRRLRACRPQRLAGAASRRWQRIRRGGDISKAAVAVATSEAAGGPAAPATDVPVP
ncbi:MAG: type IV secretory system conjugative DNA transfer family protein, partial [Acidimicrobiales bacterium]